MIVVPTRSESYWIRVGVRKRRDGGWRIYATGLRKSGKTIDGPYRFPRGLATYRNRIIRSRYNSGRASFTTILQHTANAPERVLSVRFYSSPVRRRGFSNFIARGNSPYSESPRKKKRFTGLINPRGRYIESPRKFPFASYMYHRVASFLAVVKSRNAKPWTQFFFSAKMTRR